MCQGGDQVVEGQHRPLLASRYLLFDQKQRTQHHQSHVMMPGITATHLIVGLAALTFRFPKTMLNEETLRLYPREFF